MKNNLRKKVSTAMTAVAIMTSMTSMSAFAYSDTISYNMNGNSLNGKSDTWANQDGLRWVTASTTCSLPATVSITAYIKYTYGTFTDINSSSNSSQGNTVVNARVDPDAGKQPCVNVYGKGKHTVVYQSATWTDYTYAGLVF